MWGADYPHLEGAAPVHRETLRYIFGGMPEDDIRRMLGANAVDLWGFDGALLQSVADRVGPTVADLASPLALADIEDTFSWSLARPVPLLAGRRLTRYRDASGSDAPSTAHRPPQAHRRTPSCKERSPVRRMVERSRGRRKMSAVNVLTFRRRRVTTVCFHQHMELENFAEALEALVASDAANYGDCESIEELHRLQRAFETPSSPRPRRPSRRGRSGRPTGPRRRPRGSRRVVVSHGPPPSAGFASGAPCATCPLSPRPGETVPSVSDQAQAIASARRHRTESSMARDEAMLVAQATEMGFDDFSPGPGLLEAAGRPRRGRCLRRGAQGVAQRLLGDRVSRACGWAR